MGPIAKIARLYNFNGMPTRVWTLGKIVKEAVLFLSYVYLFYSFFY